MNVSTSTSASQISAFQRPNTTNTKPAAHPIRPDGPQSRLDGLLNAWGSAESPFDLDGSGTVDVDDLLKLINSQSAPEQSETPPADDVPIDTKPADVEGPVTVEDATAGQNADAPTLEGLLAAWGESDSQYDLNNNGTVDTDDLLAFINGMSGPGSPESAQATAPPVVPEPNTAVSSVRNGRDIKSLADVMIHRLIAAGFDHQPPINLRDLVDRLDLSSRESKAMFERLRAQYPQGLGVNMVG